MNGNKRFYVVQDPLYGQGFHLFAPGQKQPVKTSVNRGHLEDAALLCDLAYEMGKREALTSTIEQLQSVVKEIQQEASDALSTG